MEELHTIHRVWIVYQELNLLPMNPLPVCGPWRGGEVCWHPRDAVKRTKFMSCSRGQMMVNGKIILVIKEDTTGRLQVRRVKNITNNLPLLCVDFIRPLIQKINWRKKRVKYRYFQTNRNTGLVAHGPVWKATWKDALPRGRRWRQEET